MSVDDRISALLQQLLPEPEDGSFRAITGYLIIAEFDDTDGAKQIAWFASPKAVSWRILGWVEWIKMRLQSILDD